MEILYISPSGLDDARVNKIAYSRAKDHGQADWHKFLVQLQKEQNFIIHSSDIYCPKSRFLIGEKLILDGSFNGQVYFQETYLEAMMSELRLLIENKEIIVHLNMGSSLAVLYAGYFLALRGIPIMTSFHNDSEGSLAIGGRSIYAQLHPYLRRKLVQVVMKNSHYVFVENEGIASALATLLPNEKHTFTLDPIVYDQESKKSAGA
ncbi:MAG: hypothetical protein NVSMB14_01420 [Isosphaeraceae bacterium]